jgi:hypothetical protein
MSSLRAAIELFVFSLVIYAAAIVTRHMFLWDVKPVSWDQEPPQNGTLEAAFMLSSIENVAAILAAIALVFACLIFIRRHRKNRHHAV